MKKLLSLIILFICSFQTFAQEQVEMADQMRQDGKIWVVIGVIAIVFVGLMTYLIVLDRKITKIEQNKN